MTPLLIIAIFFAAAIELGLRTPSLFTYWAVAASITGCKLLVEKIYTPKRIIVSCLIFAFCLGGFLGARANLPLPDFWLKAYEKPVHITGSMVPGTVERKFANSISFLVREKETGKNISLLVTKWPQGKPLPSYGTVRFFGKLEPITAMRNPGCIDSTLMAKTNNLWGRAKTWEKRVIIHREKRPILGYFHLLTEKLEGQLFKALTPRDFALLKGMTLGGSRGISSEDKESFAATGLVHLLAVSGTHVAVLAGAAFWVGRKLKLKEEYALALGAVLIIFYGLLCGLKPSIWRSILMALAYMWGRWKKVKLEGGSVLGGAMVVLLIYEPWWIRSLGFQFSFLATAGLIYLYGPLKKFFLGILPERLAEAISIPLAAQLLVLPFLIFYFHRISLASLVANVLLLPVLSLALLLTMLGLSFTIFVPVFSRLAFILAGQVLGVAMNIMAPLSKLPYATVDIKELPLVVYIAYYLLLATSFGFYPRYTARAFAWGLEKLEHKLEMVFEVETCLRMQQAVVNTTKGRARMLSAFVCLVVMCIGSFYAYFFPQPFKAYFLSVGQGDCAVLYSPMKACIVVDTGGLEGNFDTGERIILPFLRFLGVSQIDVLVLSHGHHDHAGGGAGLAKGGIPIKEVLLAPEPLSRDVEAMLSALGPKTKVTVQEKGMVRKVKDCLLEMVYVPGSVGKENEKSNNEACGFLRAQYGGSSVLFTGDAGYPEEEEALEEKAKLQSDILKLGHHGSKNSSSERFLCAVNPRLAVISCGLKNKFGHPHGVVLDRLKELKIPYKRTDYEGCVEIVLPG